jgi:hypothetical protein
MCSSSVPIVLIVSDRESPDPISKVSKKQKGNRSLLVSCPDWIDLVSDCFRFFQLFPIETPSRSDR